jgi:glucosyl-3-phosphoglycerate synthase
MLNQRITEVALEMDLEQGKIARIHDFSMDFDKMTQRLIELRDKFPSGIILPIIDTDLRNPALPTIINGINRCSYLSKVFIALSATKQKSYEEALQVSRNLKVPCDVIWCNNAKVTSILRELEKKGLDLANLQGKGKDIWLAIGIASLELHSFAIHDSDIISYSEMLPTKLLYPIIEPKLDFFFSKGYYARVSKENKKTYGRIYRLFINPMLQALQEKVDYHSEFLRYLGSFRYTLSGEIAIYSDLALNLRIPSDWGLEVGMLAELFRNASYKRICEVDLGFYDHRHKKVEQGDLLRAAEESLVCLLRTLTETDYIDVSPSFLKSLQVMYRRIAQDKIRQYHADALCNDLQYDRHEEETTVDLLAEAVFEAGKRYLTDPTSTQLPDWLRTMSAMPDVRERLREAAIEKQ